MTGQPETAWTGPSGRSSAAGDGGRAPALTPADRPTGECRATDGRGEDVVKLENLP